MYTLQAQEDSINKKADNTQLAVALSCALQGMDHQRSAARVRASSVKRKVRVMSGTRTTKLLLSLLAPCDDGAPMSDRIVIWV